MIGKKMLMWVGAGVLSVAASTGFAASAHKAHAARTTAKPAAKTHVVAASHAKKATALVKQTYEVKGIHGGKAPSAVTKAVSASHRTVARSTHKLSSAKQAGSHRAAKTVKPTAKSVSGSKSAKPAPKTTMLAASTKVSTKK